MQYRWHPKLTFLVQLLCDQRKITLWWLWCWRLLGQVIGGGAAQWGGRGAVQGGPGGRVPHRTESSLTPNTTPNPWCTTFTKTAHIHCLDKGVLHENGGGGASCTLCFPYAAVCPRPPPAPRTSHNTSSMRALDSRGVLLSHTRNWCKQFSVSSRHHPSIPTPAVTPCLQLPCPLNGLRPTLLHPSVALALLLAFEAA